VAAADEAQSSLKLREFNAVHIEEDCSNLTGMHDNELFFGCTFKNLNGLTLKDCDLNSSTFSVESISGSLGFTMTLGCHSFSDVEYSPLLFDLFLVLATMTRGNDEKREKLKDVIGRDRYEKLTRILKATE
jgi:hypothetical protein